MAMQLKDKNVQPGDLPGFVMVAGLLVRVGWGWRRFKRVFILKHKGNSKNIIGEHIIKGILIFIDYFYIRRLCLDKNYNSVKYSFSKFNQI